jgi:hypothetical protein
LNIIELDTIEYQLFVVPDIYESLTFWMHIEIIMLIIDNLEEFENLINFETQGQKAILSKNLIEN